MTLAKIITSLDKTPPQMRISKKIFMNIIINICPPFGRLYTLNTMNSWIIRRLNDSPTFQLSFLSLFFSASLSVLFSFIENSLLTPFEIALLNTWLTFYVFIFKMHFQNKSYFNLIDFYEFSNDNIGKFGRKD